MRLVDNVDWFVLFVSLFPFILELNDELQAHVDD